ncbi:MAG: endonuclease III, partial [Candidatus Pacearchaeota archaeon]|nr:endonuclease III [Candidatus Pacearchaeota archaeon]
MKSQNIIKVKNIAKIIDILAKHFNYTEKTTLNRMRCNKENPFKILISCLLSLRTQDKNTEKASKALFAVAKTPEAIANIPIKKLEKLIYSSGHYKKKARTLKHVSKEILTRFNGKVPNKKEELLSIKGIGPKTANIVLSFAFCQDVLPIDTHCHRIPNRLGWVKTKTPEQTEKALEKILPKRYWR